MYDNKGIKINGKSSNIYKKELYKLLVEIQDRLKSYFKNINNLDNKSNDELANKEIEFIKDAYDRSKQPYSDTFEFEAFKRIASKEFKSSNAISLVKEKEKLLLDDYYIKCDITKETGIGQIIKVLIYLILIIVWVYFFKELNWIINIICGWLALCFIINGYTSISNLKDTLQSKKRAIKYVNDFNNFFYIDTNHLKLK